MPSKKIRYPQWAYAAYVEALFPSILVQKHSTIFFYCIIISMAFGERNRLCAHLHLFFVPIF